MKALVLACRDEPGDRLDWLVLADWLQERGHDNRAVLDMLASVEGRKAWSGPCGTTWLEEGDGRVVSISDDKRNSRLGTLAFDLLSPRHMIGHSPWRVAGYHGEGHEAKAWLDLWRAAARWLVAHVGGLLKCSTVAKISA